MRTRDYGEIGRSIEIHIYIHAQCGMLKLSERAVPNYYYDSVYAMPHSCLKLNFAGKKINICR